MEVDICLPYAYFIVVADTGLAAFCDLCYLMIESPDLSSYVAYTHNIYHNTEMPSLVTLSPACPYVSMRIHTCPHTSIYTSLI